MTTPIDANKRMDMLRHWLALRAENPVAKACNVHLATVRKYREIDRWDDAAAEADQRARSATITDSVKRRIRSADVASQAILRMAKDMLFLPDGKTPRPTLPWDAREFKLLTELQEWLLGEAEQSDQGPLLTRKDLREHLKTLTDGDIDNIVERGRPREGAPVEGADVGPGDDRPPDPRQPHPGFQTARPAGGDLPGPSDHPGDHEAGADRDH